MVSYKTLCSSSTTICASLSHCCSGQWSSTNGTEGDLDNLMRVLILIVVDDGLVPNVDGVVNIKIFTSLNPYCSGRWSRTMIINTMNFVIV